MVTLTPECNSKTRKELFFTSLSIAEATKRNYKTGLNSSFFKDFLLTRFECKNLFDITDLEKLFEIYSAVNIHPKNEEMHRVCSAAVMKYIRFLNNGPKYPQKTQQEYPRIPKKRGRKPKNLHITHDAK